MTPGEWELLCRFLSPYVRDHLPYLPHVSPETIVGGVGLYIVVDRHGVVSYVGSVARYGDKGGIASRLTEHLTDPKRKQDWTHIHVLPLKEELTAEDVRTLEGRVGRLLRPRLNQRLPRQRRMGLR